MFSAWPAVVFGWPAVTVALVTFILALQWKQRWLGVVSVVCSAPFCLWISGYPRIAGLGMVVLGMNIAGVVLLWRGKRAAAAILWAPFLLVTGLLASVVLRQRF